MNATFGSKRLWISEFGLGTKKLGAYNAQHKQFTQFIRCRGERELREGLRSVVWEDLWDAFLEQVTPGFLCDNGVEAMFIYTLREAGVPGFDKHDDDRGNFALVTRGGRSRMEASTAERLGRFLADLARGPHAARGDAPGVATAAGRTGLAHGHPAGGGPRCDGHAFRRRGSAPLLARA